MKFGLFSSIEPIDLSKFNQIKEKNSLYYDPFDSISLRKLIYSNITELKNDYNLSEYEFYRVTGIILNICEDNCSFDFFCQNCQNRDTDMEDTNAQSSQLNFDQIEK